MKALLKVKQAWSAVESPPEAPLAAAARVKEETAWGLIALNLSAGNQSMATEHQTAQELWNALKERFAARSAMAVMALEGELVQLHRQAEETMQTYISRAKWLYDRLKAAGIRPSLIVSSPAVRAWKTARIVAKQIAYPVEFLQREPGLYHAGVNKLLDIISVQDDGFNSIMVVGHNPGLTDLANELSPGLTSNIPTAGFVSLLIGTEDWDLRTRVSVELIEYDYPKKKA